MMDGTAKTFLGIRFFLLGFDPIRQNQVRSKLVKCGGVDVGQYSPNCTHVIVDRITYDHPVCNDARNQGMTVVTDLWVHHSFDTGMPLDATSFIYRPPKDLNGIPNAKGSVVCLTGYHGQDRDDIMTLVGLMGAQFSKPLIASKVTHLICYKFEGEKYKLAKQLPLIKIVNHRWLEDCLRDWVLHPEENYKNSGYELEMMEAEARDSEDEADNTLIKQSGGRSMTKSCYNIQAGLPVPFQIPKSEGEVPMVPQNAMDKSGSRNEDKFDQAKSFSDIHASKGPDPQGAYKLKDVMHGELDDHHHKTPDSKMKDNMTSTFGTADRLAHPSKTKLSYARQSPWKPTLPLYSGDKSSNGSGSSKAPCKLNVHDGFASSCLNAAGNDKNDSNCVEAFLKGNHVHNEEELSGILSRKIAPDHPHASSKLQKTCNDAKSRILRSPSCDTSPSGKLASSIEEISGAGVSPKQSSTFTTSVTCDLPSYTAPMSDIDQDGNAIKKTPLSTFTRLRKSAISSKPVIADLVIEQSTTTVCKTVEPQNQQQDVCRSSPSTKIFVTNCEDLAKSDLRKEGTDDATKSDRMTLLSKKTLGSRPKLTTGSHKSSFNVDTVHISVSDQKKSPTAINPDLLSPDMTVEALKVDRKDVTTSGGFTEDKIDFMDDETEAPEEDQHKFENIHKEAQDIREQSKGEVDTLMEEKSEWVQNRLIDSNPHVQDNAVTLVETMKGNDRGEPDSVLIESVLKGDGVKEKRVGKKCPSGKTKLKTVPADTDARDLDKGVSEHILNQSKPCTQGNAMASVEKKNEMGQESVSMLVELTSEGDGTKGKMYSGKKRPLSKTKLKTVPVVSDKMESEKGASEHVSNHYSPCTHGDAMTSVEKMKGTEQESVSMLAEPTSKGDGAKGQKINGKKRTLGKTKLKTAPPVIDKLKPEKVASGKEIENENIDEAEIEQEKGLACPIGKSKCDNAPKNKSENSSEMKENRPITCLDENMSKTQEHARKSDVKSKLTPMLINQKLAKISRKSSTPEVQTSNRVQTQPEWFILSGHQFERKEFQQIIKRLRGKCCRDSHNWSYQATHFIIPEPIRRIEKFFAAAASGRWILKSDYLAASNQAGKFVAEEPYEWYKIGLSEDGMINLEAPRKWRLLRERTGHGALHGMRIIIYGDCIAPRLDTLKRVVKAGDGTILATCPPYTRFLNSGVDFAIVSQGMPCVDMWVQEFLKHEIPCVVADYLVEYVCKPGYSLERHVLYNTHSWAEKSFSRLQSKAEEVVVGAADAEDLNVSPVDDSASNDDIPCVVCESCDRGEVMLICGNESDSVGCGIGTHIDCCSPPLEDVPEGDWFCPKCTSQSKKSTNSSNKRKKGKSNK